MRLRQPGDEWSGESGGLVSMRVFGAQRNRAPTSELCLRWCYIVAVAGWAAPWAAPSCELSPPSVEWSWSGRLSSPSVTSIVVGRPLVGPKHGPKLWTIMGARPAGRSQVVSEDELARKQVREVVIATAQCARYLQAVLAVAETALAAMAQARSAWVPLPVLERPPPPSPPR